MRSAIYRKHIIPSTLYAIVFLLLSSSVLWAQDKQSCKRKFDEAKEMYRSGQLVDVESRIRACLTGKYLSKENRLEGLKLITESKLYLNEIKAAESSFEDLLKKDPLYMPDSLDPDNSFDLIYLAKTYNRSPMFSLYFGGSMNYSRIEVLRHYGVDHSTELSDAENYNKFTVGAGGVIGFDIPVYKNFSLVLEGNFAWRTYLYTNLQYTTAKNLDPGSTLYPLENPNNLSTLAASSNPLLYSTLTFQENQLWVDVPLMVRYTLEVKKKILLYANVGGGPNFLLHAGFSNINRTTKSEETGIGGLDVKLGYANTTITKHEDKYKGEDGKPTSHDPVRTNESLRNTLNWSICAGVGAKFRLGRDFLFIDARYFYFFQNATNRDNRYSREDLVYMYQHVDNDFRMDNVALTVGFMKGFYTPRKKRRFNPKVVENKFTNWLKKEKNNVKKVTDEELKRELNSSIKELERDKPSIIEDVRRGKVGSEIIKEEKKKFDKKKLDF
ncbi:MAG: hypothetical protein GY810_04795 [Aureispira sp.]|nr:hypothetical protein [Aureispira sp.]